MSMSAAGSTLQAIPQAPALRLDIKQGSPFPIPGPLPRSLGPSQQVLEGKSEIMTDHLRLAASVIARAIAAGEEEPEVVVQ